MGFVKDLAKSTVATVMFVGAAYGTMAAVTVIAERAKMQSVKEVDARNEVMSKLESVNNNYNDLKYRYEMILKESDEVVHYTDLVLGLGKELAEISDDIEGNTVCMGSHKNRYIRRLESIEMKAIPMRKRIEETEKAAGIE